jgi:hypothetical protein
MILPASYANGFAPRDGQPFYPELWRGCVSAWNPGLGPSGLTLRDWSGRGNHGTLTNMDPGTDWVVSQGRYALDFDGTNDYVSLGTSAVFSPSPMSIAFWLRMNTTPGAFDGIFGRTTSASWLNGYGCHWQTSSVMRFWVGQYVNAYAEIAPSTPTAWHHVVCEWVAGASPEIYVNRIKGTNSGATVATQTSTDTNLTLARLASDALNINGQIDDFRIYSRVLSGSEKAILASRRGIAYELAPRRRASVAVAAGGFNAAWIPRRSLVIGGGTN